VIRTAIVGTGGIARAHAEAVSELGDQVELVAAVDVDTKRLESFRETWGVGAGYADIGEMLEKEKPDLVQIATPPALHVPLSIKALEAGAWVLCEKPICGSLAELDRLQEAERKTGRFCSVVFQWRFGPSGQHVRNLIQSEKLGRPLVAVCNTLWYRNQAYYDVPWRGTWQSELGGVSMGQGIHIMDLLLYLLGDWSEIRATIGTLDRTIEVEDVSMAMVRFENGALGSIVNSVLSPRQESYLRMDFERATVELTTLYSYSSDNWKLSPRENAPPQELEALQEWQNVPKHKRASHAGPLQHVIDCMRTNQPPTSGAEARRMVEFLTSLYKSAMTGETVKRGSIQPGDPFYGGVAAVAV
jgi:predicted dehydrogenase